MICLVFGLIINKTVYNNFMGTAQVKSKPNNTKGEADPPKFQIKIEIDIDKAVPTQVTQLTNWSLSEIKEAYMSFQRISESPVVDCFLFKKMMVSLTKKNSDIIFSILSQGQKYISIFEIVCILILTSYQTYRKKFQFLCLIFDFQHKGNINGRQFLLAFYSMIYGYCRLTAQSKPDFEKVQRYAQACFFPGEDDYEEKLIGLHKLVEQYDGNSNISHIFTRFEHFQFKEIRDNLLVYSLSELKKYTNYQTEKYYRILIKIYSKKDYEEILMMEQNRELRRQNRRDECFKRLIEQKQLAKFQSPPILKKRALSFNKFNSLAPKSQRVVKLSQTPKGQELFRIKKVHSISKSKPQPLEKKKLFFLNGHSHTKNEIFEAISYFKSLSGSEDKVTIKQFFKKFDKKIFLKKQLSNIFKYLDFYQKGELTLKGFFKSFYPGIRDQELMLINKWYGEYQQIYEADLLIRNQPKPVSMTDARELPYETLQRLKEIFKAVDIEKKAYLNFEDLRKAYKQGFTATQLQNLLSEYGDGKKIEFSGFCKMLLPIGWQIQGINLNTLTYSQT